ncbi:toxin-antitoxin system YwqK family antitoxin [Maribellus sp. YY47]|uniref:toxin-antitoxin system YwqK family antitoxin n=1 Tax=Maribellus sp. YY47 TaxID=2929486 RepID=UPI002000E0CE|nr:toxin-antitoxin system YwqK family antitoxin [Maribellus sp. YY47]MCK3684306.1 toxin-antitoxin system YwqK family antitoxin [Maribellus sp. YY47]
MRTYIVLILSILINLSVSGQTENETVHYFDGLFPKNGLFIRPDSLPDGVWIAYCETNPSQIGLKLHYKNGKRNGETIAYWPNGNIQQKGLYQDGCLVGLNEKWYENGEKESDSNCEIDNIKLQHSQCHIINYWSKTGSQLIKDGTGKYISYHDNDTLQVNGEYLNSLQTGQWTWHYDNGDLQYIEHFSQGKRDGEYIFYYINGQIRNRGMYLNGKQIGEWIHWYQDGKMEEYENRLNGLRNGEYKYWHRNGKLYASGHYELGKETGVWEYFNENGKLEKKEIYKNGKLKRTKSYR